MMFFQNTNLHLGVRKDQLLADVLTPAPDEIGVRRRRYEDLLRSAQREIRSIRYPGDKGAMDIAFDSRDVQLMAQLAYVIASRTGRTVQYDFNRTKVSMSPHDARPLASTKLTPSAALAGDRCPPGHTKG